MSGSSQPSFSTELSPGLMDMPERAQNGVTAPPIDPAAGKPRRRRAASLDPRRSPGGLAADAQPDPIAGGRPAVRPELEPEEPAARALGAGGIAGGVAVLRAALRNVPASPGVCRMLDRKGDAVYVGKARNLKSRVQNYTHPAGLSNRLRRMVAETAALEIV